MSRIDQLYRRLLLTKFFTKGWGKPDNLKRIFEFRKILSDREKCQHLVSSTHPIYIDKEYKDGDCRILEGHFMSPLIDHLPGIVPKEVETASFQMILPLQWRHKSLKPVCIHLAGTGDHYFWRRRLLTARPLLKETGIASIMLENPYYGSRKPKSQLRSSLHNVSDLFVMGGALVVESLALLHWCERKGWGPLGISGISMGGHMESGAAAVWPKPVSLIPLLSWTTASTCFTEGVMSGAIPWELLQEQFFENSVYQDEISKLIVSPERNNGNAYRMGKQFVINYSQSEPQIQKHHQDSLHSKTDPPPNHHHTVTRTSKNNSDKFHREKQTSDSSQSKDCNILEETISPNENRASTTSFYSTSERSSSQSEGDRNANSASGSSTDVTTDTTDISSKRESPQTTSRLRMIGQALTLNYAQTKQFQQSKISGKSDGKPLTLGHAQAKSKLMVSQLDKKQQPVSYALNMKSLQKESYDFMIGVMDECTHLGNFSVPVDPELIIIVSAKQDAYVPREGVLGLDQIWPGCEVRYIDQGHVGAVVLHQAAFRKAIKDSFDRQIKKYYSDQMPKGRSHQYFFQSRKAS